MQAITTRYLVPSNFKGSRIKAFNADKKAATLSYDHALNSEENHAKAARALCDKMNWKGELVGGYLAGSDMIWVFPDDRLKA